MYAMFTNDRHNTVLVLISAGIALIVMSSFDPGTGFSHQQAGPWR
jgi:hypothetical protein